MTEKQKVERYQTFEEEIPVYFNNIIQLKALVWEKAKQFNVVGDIDIDNGHSFSYNITIMFPALFQR